jgi:hypothetical protein
MQKFYMNDAATADLGTMPSTNQSSTAPVVTETGATTARKLSGAAAGSQVADAGSAQTSAVWHWLRQFVSAPLAAQTIATGNWTVEIGGLSSSASRTFTGYVVIFVWRPSTGALVGKIFDSAGTGFGTGVGTSETGIGSTTLSGSAVTVLQGDILCVQVGMQCSSGSSATPTLDYDGTTDPANGTAVASAASFMNAPADIPLYVPSPYPIQGMVGRREDNI